MRKQATASRSIRHSTMHRTMKSRTTKNTPRTKSLTVPKASITKSITTMGSQPSKVPHTMRTPTPPRSVSRNPTLPRHKTFRRTTTPRKTIRPAPATIGLVRTTAEAMTVAKIAVGIAEATVAGGDVGVVAAEDAVVDARKVVRADAIFLRRNTHRRKVILTATIRAATIIAAASAVSNRAVRNHAGTTIAAGTASAVPLRLLRATRQKRQFFFRANR